MRVLLVGTELNEGGAENALQQVACGLVDRGHDVQVLALYGSNGGPGERLQEAGIVVHDAGVHNWYHFPRLFAILRSTTRTFAPDLVNAWLFHANLVCRLALPRKLPLVCSLRVCEPRKWQILADRWSRRRVDLYVANSRDVADFAEHRLKVPSTKCRVITNGVSSETFRQARRPRLDDAKLCGLTVARVVPQKGIDILLRALASLSDDLPWHWTFAGGCPEPAYAQAMKTLAVELGISEKIQWRGPVSREKMVDEFRAATLCALPSRWEGEPNVVLEAMAADLPVLAAAVKGINAMLTDNPGCLIRVSENTPDYWSRELTRVWENLPTLAPIIEAGRHAVEKRSWSKTVEKHEQAYGKILNLWQQ